MINCIITILIIIIIILVITITNTIIIITIIITGPKPAFGRLGLGGSSGVNTLGKGKISKNVTYKHTLHHYIYIMIIIMIIIIKPFINSDELH